MNKLNEQNNNYGDVVESEIKWNSNKDYTGDKISIIWERKLNRIMARRKPRKQFIKQRVDDMGARECISSTWGDKHGLWEETLYFTSWHQPILVFRTFGVEFQTFIKINKKY